MNSDKKRLLNPRTKQDNSRFKLNTQNPPWWQEHDAPAQKKIREGNQWTRPLQGSVRG